MTHPLRMRICLPAIAAAVAAALMLPAAAPADSVVPGQVIVGYEAGSSQADRSEARADAGTKPIEGLGMPRAQLLKITDGDSVAATVRQLEAQPGVAYADPNGIMQLASVPNDPLFSQQWGLFNDGQTVDGVAGTIGSDIGAPQAWNIATGDPSTVVAVMDTGADLTHPDLVNELWTNPLEATGTPGVDDDGNGYVDDVNGYDFIGAGSPTPSDRTGHGTHVSGIIAAEGNNGIDTTGVAQRASLMELRVCGTYTAGCPVANEIQAINYAGANGARVLNASLQGGTFYPSLQQALSNNPDVLYVFAAGNQGTNNDVTPSYPCSLDQSGGYSADNVICVAATDQSDGLASFSNYGASSVDLGAPGVNILSTSSQRTIFADDFEGGDFGTKWTSTSGTAWQTTSEAPLDTIGSPGNVGITDSPGGLDYNAGTTYEEESNPVTLPAGYSTCELDYWRAVDLGAGDSFVIEVLHDGSVEASSVDFGDPQFGLNHSAHDGSITLNPDFDSGGQVQVRLTLTSNGSGEDDGVHMDNIRLFCHGSPSDAFFDDTSPTGTELLDGTSMATPMVSGAAALLFSQAPSSTPSQVKTELLNSVDPLPSLAGKTVTGGRLDVYRALVGDFNPSGGGGGGGGGSGSSAGSGSSPRKPNTFFARKPGRVVRTHKPSARVVFRFGSDQVGSGFECQVDGLPYVPCTKRYALRLPPGRHVLKVKAITSDGGTDPSAAVAKFRVKHIVR
jgi:subtilisin family serine protease